jgi:hypothetical protein
MSLQIHHIISTKTGFTRNFVIRPSFRLASSKSAGHSHGNSHNQKKVYPSSAAALGVIPNGSKVLIGGFGACGLPENLIKALKASGAKDLVTVSNNLQGRYKCIAHSFIRLLQ